VREEREAGFALGLPFEIELRALRKDGQQQGKPFTNESIQVIGVNDHLPTPTFPLLQGQAGVLVPTSVQKFLGSIREARPQERGNRVDERVWSRAASWRSFSGASLCSWFSESRANSLMLTQSAEVSEPISMILNQNLKPSSAEWLHAQFSAKAEITA